jgi:hypothetical protein
LRSPARGIKFSDQPGDIVKTMRSLRMPGDLGLLPGREVGVSSSRRRRF